MAPLRNERRCIAKYIDGPADKGDRRKQKPVCNELDSVLSRNAKACRLPIGYSLRDNLENRGMKKQQMTTEGNLPAAGAPSTTWSDIKWQKVESNVHRLQMRIAKAERENSPNKVKSLQWLLTHSLEAKLLAVKRVTSSKGAKTPGIDGKLYLSNTDKMQLALSLKQRGLNKYFALQFCRCSQLKF